MFKSITFLIVLSLTACATKQEKAFTIASNHVSILEGNAIDFKGTENIIYLPENRNTPETRTTGVHYFHFPAKTQTNLAPVFYLPSGPGVGITAYRFYEKGGGWRAVVFSAELMEYNKTRDIVIINQRGNPWAPGAPSPYLSYSYISGDDENEKKAITRRMNDLKDDGLDPLGYDFANLVDDVEDIRKQYNYDKVALLGNSFGSQWAFGYIERYPQHVEKALMATAEPLSHEYDDPKSIWNVLKRLEAYANENASIATQIPEIGLTNAIKRIVERLEAQPQKVRLTVPKHSLNEDITVTAEDFRNFPYYKWYTESWPKYITELYNEDYRFLALWKWERENLSKEKSKLELIVPIINTSIGISETRKKELESREELKWISNPLKVLDMWKEIIPVKDIGDDFRQQDKHNIPLVILQGDLDLSTPMESAYYLQEIFEENMHLITINKAPHGMKQKIMLDEDISQPLYDFMNADFSKTSFEEFKKTLPSEYDALPEIEFTEIGGKSLFEIDIEK